MTGLGLLLLCIVRCKVSLNLTLSYPCAPKPKNVGGKPSEQPFCFGGLID